MLPDRKNIPEREQLVVSGDGDRGTNASFLIFAALHFVCCGLPLLLLSGVSLAFLAPLWPVAAGVLAVVGVVGFAWYLKRGCATCPRNEGQCPAHQKS